MNIFAVIFFGFYELCLIYVLGYVAAALLWSHKDYQKSLSQYRAIYGESPDYRVYSWYFVWQCRKWIWKEVKFKLINNRTQI